MNKGVLKITEKEDIFKRMRSNDETRKIGTSIIIQLCSIRQRYLIGSCFHEFEKNGMYVFPIGDVTACILYYNFIGIR